MVSVRNFADRLTGRMTERGTRVVVGLDPDLERIRRIPEFAGCGTEEALRGFCSAILAACAPFACAVKPQIAYFECWGTEGWRALGQVGQLARSLRVPLILDAKRGDIGSTCTAYARLLDPEGPLGGVDAMTVNPYLGGDSVEPFLAACREHGSGLFVLAKTSNPSASELQDLRLEDGRRVCEAVADLVAGWGEGLIGQSGHSSVGAVVGATQYEDLVALRERMPKAVWLLPGVGAQGADVAKLRSAFGEDTLGACVSSSRGVLYAWEKDSPDCPAAFAERAAVAAERLREEIAALLG
jgi:orotidine-5'-phosphate decarboxylase